MDSLSNSEILIRWFLGPLGRFFIHFGDLWWKLTIKTFSRREWCQLSISPFVVHVISWHLTQITIFYHLNEEPKIDWFKCFWLAMYQVFFLVMDHFFQNCLPHCLLVAYDLPTILALSVKFWRIYQICREEMMFGGRWMCGQIYGGMCILRNGGNGGNEDQSEPQGGAGGVTAGK